MDKFSVSEASVFKSCPRLYYFRYILGWEPAVKPPWLSAGSNYDKLLEYYDLGGVHAANIHIPELFPNTFEAIDAQYLLAQYHAKLGHDPLLPVEGGNQYGFGQPFYGNEVTGPVSFKFTGYMDKVSQKGDELIITERKTTSESIEENSEYWKKLPLDPQIRAYAWFLLSQGNNAGWVAYEVIRKLSTTVGAAFNKKCSTEEYRERLMKHTEKKTLVARKMVFVSQDMADDFITDMGLTFLQIQACKKKQQEIEEAGYSPEYAWTKSTGSCGSFGGCAFRPVDEGLVTLEQADLVKSSKWIKNNAKS